MKKISYIFSILYFDCLDRVEYRVQSTDWTVKTLAFWQIFSIVWGENCPRVKVSSKHFVKPLVSFQISEEKVKLSQQKFNVEKLTL